MTSLSNAVMSTLLSPPDNDSVGSSIPPSPSSGSLLFGSQSSSSDSSM